MGFPRPREIGSTMLPTSPRHHMYLEIRRLGARVTHLEDISDFRGVRGTVRLYTL